MEIALERIQTRLNGFRTTCTGITQYALQHSAEEDQLVGQLCRAAKAIWDILVEKAEDLDDPAVRTTLGEQVDQVYNATLTLGNSFQERFYDAACPAIVFAGRLKREFVLTLNLICHADEAERDQVKDDRLAYLEDTFDRLSAKCLSQYS